MLLTVNAAPVFTKGTAKQALDVIEQEFGTKWLNKRVPAHPIKKSWRQTTNLLNTLGSNNAHILDPDVSLFIKFALELDAARKLPNYDQAIPPRLKGNDLDKVKYETFVAALIVESDLQAEFIPVSKNSGDRTADFKIDTTFGTIYVECKRKDSYVASPEKGDKNSGYLIDNLMAMQEDLGTSHEIICFLPEAIEALSIQKLVGRARQHLSHKQLGLTVDPDTGYGLLIRPIKPVSGSKQGLSVDMSSSPRPVGSRTLIQMRGGLPTNPRRVSICVFKSHKLKTIINSFNSARGQIPEQGQGVIYIDLDVSQLSEGEVVPYLECMHTAVLRLFTPTDNTRVGAVVLTTQPISQNAQVENNVVASYQVLLSVIKNPHFVLDARIPQFQRANTISAQEEYTTAINIEHEIPRLF